MNSPGSHVEMQDNLSDDMYGVDPAHAHMFIKVPCLATWPDGQVAKHFVPSMDR